jgi:hypothetical protein
MSVTVGDSAPHSALHSPEDPLGDAHASVRAPARESHESTAQSNPKSALTERDYFGEAWTWLKDWITPPEIWTEGSAPLKQEWEYACRGEWTTRDGFVRMAGQAYQIFVAFPVTTVCDYLKWIVKRPSRHAAAWLLLCLLAQFPPVSWLI